MSALFIIGIRCPYCQKFRSPKDIIQLPASMRICVDCEQRHIEAVRALSTGRFDGACSECGKTAEQLGGADLKMAVHYENGKYRPMCLECDATYTTKRKELYAGTEFGRSL